MSPFVYIRTIVLGLLLGCGVYGLDRYLKYEPEAVDPLLLRVEWKTLPKDLDMWRVRLPSRNIGRRRVRRNPEIDNGFLSDSDFFVRWVSSIPVIAICGPTSENIEDWQGLDLGLKPITSVLEHTSQTSSNGNPLRGLAVCGFNSEGRSTVLYVHLNRQTCSGTSVEVETVSVAEDGGLYSFVSILENGQLWAYDSRNMSVVAFEDGRGRGDFDSLVSSDFPINLQEIAWGFGPPGEFVQDQPDGPVYSIERSLSCEVYDDSYLYFEQSGWLRWRARVHE